MQANARNQTQFDTLTAKQQKVIAALLSEPTTKQAAQSAGVNEATIWRWLQLKPFQTAYLAARRETVKQSIARLQKKTGDAVDVLSEIMQSQNVPGSVRVSAAKAVIEYAIKSVEVEDLAHRVEELEALINAKPGGK